MKVSSRNKQLQRYKGNWATLEIMKTLLKNQRTCRHHIRSLDQIDEDNTMNSKDSEDHNLNPKDSDGEEDDNLNPKDSDGDGDDGTKMEDWDDMYQNKIDEENRSGGDEVDDSEGFNGGEDEGGYSGKKIKGGNGEGSRIASAKQAGTKRKVTQDDEPATATRMKRKKLNGSEAHPAANTKKVLPKQKYSKE